MYVSPGPWNHRERSCPLWRTGIKGLGGGVRTHHRVCISYFFPIFTFWQLRSCWVGPDAPHCKRGTVIKKLSAFIRQGFFQPASLHLILIITLQSRHFCLPSGMSCKRMRVFEGKRREPITGLASPPPASTIPFN